jgi:hypothetical protein
MHRLVRQWAPHRPRRSYRMGGYDARIHHFTL